MNKPYLLILGLAAIVTGLIGLVFLQMYPSLFESSDSKTSQDTFSSIGERIYFSGVGKNGPILFRGGPRWLRIHGGSCASCHGADGKGGIPIMMSNEEAPAISFEALTEEEHHDDDEEQEEHPPYNEKLIKRAITEGIDPAGKPLGLTMPRWQMPKEDLDELIDFLETLD